MIVKPKTDITTRLQKGGALLSDMRLMVNAWSDEMAELDPIPFLARVLPKTTMARVKDTFVRAFRPRFLEGSPSHAWRLARTLEELEADLQIIRSFYYWITARSEGALYGFVSEVVYSRSRSAHRDVRVEDAVAWISPNLGKTGKSWTPTVTLKVARGMLAALRDFGILEGSVKKHIAAFHLSPEAFALIAFCINDLGVDGRELVKHLDWRLFLTGETGVEHLLLECHQHGWLRFEVAGELCRTEFPDVSFKEFAHGVLG